MRDGSGRPGRGLGSCSRANGVTTLQWLVDHRYRRSGPGMCIDSLCPYYGLCAAVCEAARARTHQWAGGDLTQADFGRDLLGQRRVTPAPSGGELSPSRPAQWLAAQARTVRSCPSTSEAQRLPVGGITLKGGDLRR